MAAADLQFNRECSFNVVITALINSWLAEAAFLSVDDAGPSSRTVGCR
jgi:hypothetical protein